VSNNETPQNAKHAAVLAFIEASAGSKTFRLFTLKNQPIRTTVPTDMATMATLCVKIFNLEIEATLRTELSIEACL
jgi:hypothetical protein